RAHVNTGVRFPAAAERGFPPRRGPHPAAFRPLQPTTRRPINHMTPWTYLFHNHRHIRNSRRLGSIENALHIIRRNVRHRSRRKGLLLIPGLRRRRRELQPRQVRQQEYVPPSHPASRSQFPPTPSPT